MLFAQITDTHINTCSPSPFNGRDADDYLTRAVNYLNQLHNQPQFVLLTGDCVHQGQPAEYQKLASILGNLKMPCYLIPGNHDDRALLSEFFPHIRQKCQGNAFIQYTLEYDDHRFIGLDTLKVGDTHRELCASRLNWLEHTLNQQPEKPTVLFMHHPPTAYGIDILDTHANHSSDALAQVLADHPQVHTILCGHFHGACHTTWQNRTVHVAASALIQFSPDIGDTPTRLQWSNEPGGLALHRTHQQSLITQFCTVPSA